MSAERFYEFFYCGEQTDEAKAFQRETGWHMIWGSDYQGLNGDTWVVYRNVEDLPVWLQDYAREEENNPSNLKRHGIDLKEELHQREMINSYVFFMNKYFNENKAFHFPTNIVEHDETCYVLNYEGRKITIEFDPSWSQLVYSVNGRGPFAHTSYEHIWDDIQSVLALEDKERFQLAVKLNAFYKDFDFYDYMDSVDGAQTEEDLVEGIAEQFSDLKAVDGIVAFLTDIKENGEPDEGQRKTLDELLKEMSSVQASLVKSVDEILAEADSRCNENGNKASTKDDLGKE